MRKYHPYTFTLKTILIQVLLFFSVCIVVNGQARLSLDNNTIELGTIDANSNVPIVIEKKIRFTNTGDKPLTISDIRTQYRKYLKFNYPSTPIAPNGSGIITATFTIDTKDSGPLISSGRNRYTAHIVNNIVDDITRIWFDFDFIDTYPESKIKFLVDTVRFGVVDGRKPKSATAVLSFKNLGTLPITIESIRSSEGQITSTLPKGSIAPNGTAKIPLSWNRIDTLMEGINWEKIIVSYNNKKPNYRHYKSYVKETNATIDVKNPLGTYEVNGSTDGLLHICHKHYLDLQPKGEWSGLRPGVAYIKKEKGEGLVFIFDVSSFTSKEIEYLSKECYKNNGLDNQELRITLSNNETLVSKAHLHYNVRDELKGKVFSGISIQFSLIESSSLISFANLSSYDRTKYFAKQIRTYDIKKIDISGTIIENKGNTKTAYILDKICSLLEEKTNSNIFKYDGNTQPSSTRTNSSTNTAQKSPTPSRTETTTVAHTATVENLQVLQDQKVNGEYGISFNMNTNIKGARGRECDVIIFFYNKDGKPLKDFNGKYCTKDGSVCAWKDITPSYNNSSWEDMSIFIPYSELHIVGSGTSDIMYKLQVRDLSEEKREGEKMVMYSTEKTIITVPLRPEVKLNKVWVDYNIRQQFSNGLLIHANMEANNLKNKKLTFSVKFYKADNQTKLTDIFGNHISRETTFTPDYNGSVWKDFQFFIPYTAMNYASDKSGLYSLDVEILDRNGNVLRRWENIPLQRLY